MGSRVLECDGELIAWFNSLFDVGGVWRSCGALPCLVVVVFLMPVR